MYNRLNQKRMLRRNFLQKAFLFLFAGVVMFSIWSGEACASAAGFIAAAGVSSVIVGGKQEDTDTIVTMQAGDTIVVTGTTVENGHVTLTIPAESVTVTADADGAGHWSQTMKTDNYRGGYHEIYTVAHDQANTQQSPQARILMFDVSAVGTAATPNRATATQQLSQGTRKNNLGGTWFWGLMVISFVGVTAALLYWRKIRKLTRR